MQLRITQPNERQKMNYSKLRKALRDKYGKRNYRIDRNDLVHVYGVMPNSNIVGWWFMGDIINAELWLGFYDERLNERLIRGELC